MTISIRQANKDDLSTLCKWYADGELMKDVGFPEALKVDRLQLSKRLENPPEDRGLYMILNEKKETIGELSYHDLTQKDCGIGIKIAVAYQGKGYGRAALSYFVNFLFEKFRLESIHLDPMVENKRAIYLYKQIGFVEEAILHDCWTDPKGVKHHAVKLRLYRSEDI